MKFRIQYCGVFAQCEWYGRCARTTVDVGSRYELMINVDGAVHFCQYKLVVTERLILFGRRDGPVATTLGGTFNISK